MKKFIVEHLTDVYSSYEKPPQDFTSINFETANKSPDSLWQIGRGKVSGNQIVDKEKYLIRTTYKKFIFIDIYEITLEDVKDAPTFADL